MEVNERDPARASNWTSRRIAYLPQVWPRPALSPSHRAARSLSISLFCPLCTSELTLLQIRKGVSVRGENYGSEERPRFIALNSSLQGVHQAFFDALRRSQRILGRRKLYISVSHPYQPAYVAQTRLSASKADQNEIQQRRESKKLTIIAYPSPVQSLQVSPSKSPRPRAANAPSP